MIIWWVVSVVSLIFILIMLYCCLVVASIADDQIDKLMKELENDNEI